MLFEPFVRFNVFACFRLAGWSSVGGWLLARLAVCFLSVGA